jgi:hypothetical protein
MVVFAAFVVKLDKVLFGMKDYQIALVAVGAMVWNDFLLLYLSTMSMIMA